MAVIRKKVKKKEEDCVLCESSEIALKKLKRNKTPQKKNSVLISQKIIFLIILIIFLGVVGGYKLLTNFNNNFKEKDDSVVNWSVVENVNPKVNQLAPDFVTEDIFGNRVVLSDFRNNKPVLLIFWATWCKYCAQEFPDLKVFKEAYQDKIEILAIDSGEERKEILKYNNRKGVNFTMLMDKQRKIWNQYLVRGTPSHFLINKAGKIILMRPGVASPTDLEVMLSMVDIE